MWGGRDDCPGRPQRCRGGAGVQQQRCDSATMSWRPGDVARRRTAARTARWREAVDLRLPRRPGVAGTTAQGRRGTAMEAAAIRVVATARRLSGGAASLGRGRWWPDRFECVRRSRRRCDRDGRSRGRRDGVRRTQERGQRQGGCCASWLRDVCAWRLAFGVCRVRRRRIIAKTLAVGTMTRVQVRGQDFYVRAGTKKGYPRRIRGG